MATHYSILAWKIPWVETLGWLQSMGSQIAGHDWIHTHIVFQTGHEGELGITKCLSCRKGCFLSLNLLHKEISLFSLILLPVILMNTWWEKRIIVLVQFFSCSIMSDSLWLHGLQHTRPPCPSSTPKVYSNSCPLSLWCHPTISSSVVPFFSCPQSFPASGSFQMSQFFPSGGQSIGVSASTPVTPMNTQDWSPLGWTGWISFQSRGEDSQESSPTPQFKSINSSALSFLYSSTLTSIHDYWKNHSFD